MFKLFVPEQVTEKVYNKKQDKIIDYADSLGIKIVSMLSFWEEGKVSMMNVFSKEEGSYEAYKILQRPIEERRKLLDVLKKSLNLEEKKNHK